MIRKYAKHFYDPIRIEIAVAQIQHDFRKLFPNLDQKAFKSIDRNVTKWPKGEDYELEPIHDFWNFFAGFTRELKFKSLLSWITAENVIWSKKDVSLKDIFLTWDFPGLEFMGKAPYCADDVSKILNDKDMKLYKEEMKKEAAWRSERFPPRDQFRVILFFDERGKTLGKSPGYYILEGNRRITRAVLFNEKKIPAYVGRFSGPKEIWPQNYWFATGFLGDLIFLSLYYQKEKDNVAFGFLRRFYQLLLRDFECLRSVTFNRAFKLMEKNDRLMKEIFKEDLK